MPHWAPLCLAQDQINYETHAWIHFSNLHSVSHAMIFFGSLEINQGIAPTLNQVLVVFFLPVKTEQMFPAAPDLDSEAGLILSAQELQLKEVQFGHLRSDSPFLTTAGSFLPQLSAHIAVINEKAGQCSRALRKHAHKDGHAGGSYRWKRRQNVTSLISLKCCQ